ncbi:Hint domain-containing protein [Acetobacter sp. AAB5]|uniref:Hint domain-containing protein n=1 Tax=Acetobacter sp. AAB5 TaxID=3418370 RepID=UPI003CF13AF4
MASESYSNDTVTYTLTPGFLTNTAVITDAAGNTLATVTAPGINFLTGTSSELIPVDVGGGSFVSVPGSQGGFNFLINALSANFFYIGGETTVTFAVSAVTGQTFDVYGGNLTFSSGLVASALSGSTINIGYGGTYSSGVNLASILNGSTINFTTGGGTLILNAGGTLLDLTASTITGYDPAKDTIELQNTTQPISGYVIAGTGTSRTITLMDAGGNAIANYTVTLADGANVPAGVYNNAVDSTDLTKNPLDITYSGGNTYIGACFLAGSMIRTSSGDVAVEDIRIGDAIVAFDWRNNTDIVRPVVWVGKAHVNVRHGLADDEAGWPVRILKDAIADGVPYKDMLITAEHCLFFKDRFVPVRMLVNGVSIFYDKSISSYDYYHVETERHSVITADGMLTESYLDTGNRSSFRQEGKVATLRGAVKSWKDDAGAPLDVERSFVEPLFRALEWRENSVSGCYVPEEKLEITNDPDLRLITDTGAVVRPMRKTAHQYSFMLPPDTQSVRIVSRASRPSDVIGPFVDDRRRMGVAVSDVHLLCAKRSFEITSHLQTQKPEGWYDTDWTDCAWTNGDAVLPLGDHLTHGKMGILSLIIRAAGPYLMTEKEAILSKIGTA